MKSPPSPSQRAQDETYMKLALERARRGLGRTSPNPAVGAVIVRDGEVVAMGHHRRAGLPHAEREALAAATGPVRGGTLYVTLEPCCHHGRTGPCTEAIITAGIERVVAGHQDPNPQVAGQGLSLLREAGVEVTCGVLEEACARLIDPFRKLIGTGRPWVTAKYAMTLDGKIASRTGSSQWISNDSSRKRAHQLRDRHDAILVGTTTLLRDNPSLTTRGVKDGRDPVRIILDARGGISAEAQVLTQASEAPTWVVCGPEATESTRAKLTERDQAIAIDLDEAGRIPIQKLLEELGRRGVMTLLVEGGGQTLGALLDSGEVDEVAVFIAPRLVGGAQAPTPMAGRGFESIEAGVRLTNVEIEEIEGDVLVTGRIRTG